MRIGEYGWGGGGEEEYSEMNTFYNWEPVEGMEDRG